MRQGQQNRRGRGRNNNRKGGHNPLARSFESNGPDVKIRGTPAHIAEKYLTLARDAQSSGDPVLAENYLQHAEHYTRIIMAYREQLQQPGDMSNGNGQRMRAEGDIGDEFGDDDTEEGLDDPFQPPMPQQMHPQGQPRQQGGYDGNRNDGNRHDRPYRRDHVRGFRSDRDRIVIATGESRAMPKAALWPQNASRSASRNAHRSRRKPGAGESSVAATGSRRRSSSTSSPNFCAVRCAAPAARTASQPRPPRKSRGIDTRQHGFSSFPQARSAPAGMHPQTRPAGLGTGFPLALRLAGMTAADGPTRAR